jgi:Tol biopolymer transport system component
VEDSLSTIFDGTIVLDRFKQGEESSSIYFLDLKTNHQVALGRGFDISISPDGTKVAYSNLDFDVVDVADITGILMQIPQEPGENLRPVGWLDNQRLMLDRHLWDSNEVSRSKSLVVLNIITGEKKEWFQDYPNFNDIHNDVFWTPDSRLIPSPKFGYLIYPVFEGVVLWDIDSQQEVARINGALSASTPEWSPDGTRFVISASPEFQDYTNTNGELSYKGGFELFLVNYTGEIERLTYFSIEEISFQRSYHWSPDGQHILFLLQTGSFGEIDSGDLAVVNVNTGEVTLYCVGGFADWTSDGRYILLTQTDNNLKTSEYLLDPQSAYTYLIAEDAYAIGGTIRNP